MEALGRQLRRRYSTLLGPSPETVKVRTTNVPRCVESAQAVMHGAFPDATVPPTMPLVFRTMHSSEEYLTPNTKRCPRLAELWSAGREFFGMRGGTATSSMRVLKCEGSRGLGPKKKEKKRRKVNK